MPSARGTALSAGLQAPRRIDGGELAVERVRRRLGNVLQRAHRAQRTDRRAQQRDAGEEQQGFLFVRGWHAATLTS
jgi:hypothetical protein